MKTKTIDAAYEFARARKKAWRERHEDNFAFQLKAFRLPSFERQYRFARSIGRDWRFDFACVEFMVAVEVEGIIVRRDESTGRNVSSGGHVDITGFKRDCVKYANAAILGWAVLRFEQSQIESREALTLTQQLLHVKGFRAS